jgi:hypothetical protein
MSEEIQLLREVEDDLREARKKIARAMAIDTLGTPNSYRMLLGVVTAAQVDTEGMLDTREWADMDGEATG